MELILGSDHAGFELKERIKRYLEDTKIEYKDVGCFSGDRCDYPDYARLVARSISKGEYERGVLICGTGIGMSICANRFPRIRAALCRDINDAEMSRRHNNSNILVLGGRKTPQDLAIIILKTWLGTDFEGGRYQQRIDKT
jgi:ribose 5-phosphate isomerase B